MGNSLEKILSNISWRNKILTLSCAFSVVMLAIGLIGAYNINKTNKALHAAHQASTVRMQMAIDDTGEHDDRETRI